jgi:hypothetical protein
LSEKGRLQRSQVPLVKNGILDVGSAPKNGFSMAVGHVGFMS